MQVVTETNLPLKLKRGKVRDNYEIDKIDKDRLLIVATDRTSCFDVVLPDGISGKGRVLNKISVFWFNFLRNFKKREGIPGGWKIDDHFISDDIWSLWIEGILSSRYIDENDLVGRSMIVQKMDVVIPIECVMRSVLTGSAWAEYKKTGTVCGEELRWKNLREGDRFPEPIFTPATKAEVGHDQNISRAEMALILARFEVPGWGKLGEEGGQALTELLELQSNVIFFLGRMWANTRGIDIRDTKFEFGIKLDENGEPRVILIDEVLTPDSSRFAVKDQETGKWLINYDKQLARDWLEQENWNKEPPAPRLPEAIKQETSRRYREIYERLVR